MNNMTIWDAVSKPPEEALKPITGGRLKGMTDINPQWRLKAMTEQFGPIGIGWKYEIVERWNEAMGEQIACFVHIRLYYLQDDKWSAPIEGLGGSMLFIKEKAGMHVSDEGYKMALTDALSVAMKQLGVAADIYAGFYDGKYRKQAAPQVGDELPVPSPEEMEVLNLIWEGLLDSTPDGMELSSDRIAKFIYGQKGEYISDKTLVNTIVSYIANQIEFVCVKI